MSALNTRITKLERTVAKLPSIDKWEDAKIITALMHEATCPPDPNDPDARAEGIRRLKERMAAVDPHDPQPPSIVDECLAQSLGVDLLDFAVNDKHREVLRESKLGA